MKILLYDIETTPNLAYVWGKYEQNVIRFKKQWQLLSFAYKWLGEKEVSYVSATGQRSDKKLVKALHNLITQSDISIAHYGDEFDNKKSNARFIFYNLRPPPPRHTIDTKKVATKYFKFNGNGLDDLGEYFGFGRKHKHEGIDLWFKCMAGDKKADKQMELYNKQDVVLLEKIYLRMRPWITNHPRVCFKRARSCRACGSTALRSNGYRASATKLYRRLVCLDCGAWNREVKSQPDIKTEVV